MITTILAAAVTASLISANTPAPDPSEQLLLEQIHRCAVEDPMPDFCEPLLQQLMEGGER